MNLLNAATSAASEVCSDRVGGAAANEPTPEDGGEECQATTILRSVFRKYIEFWSAF